MFCLKDCGKPRLDTLACALNERIQVGGVGGDRIKGRGVRTYSVLVWFRRHNMKDSTTEMLCPIRGICYENAPVQVANMRRVE
jgi:hypothetical protein